MADTEKQNTTVIPDGVDNPLEEETKDVQSTKPKEIEKPAVVKMETKYNETEFPRKDNYFRSKNSLSF